MSFFDVVVIGGGPAGMMASVAAGKCGRRVALLERNSCLGKKLLISGSGRCNLAQEGSPEDFLSVFADRAAFLKPAAYALPYKKITEFFNANGLKLKSQQGRVFPVSDRARDVVAAFERALKEAGVKIIKGEKVLQISVDKKSRTFSVITENKAFSCNALILCCGGATYKRTGSDGSGYRLAISLGHKIERLSPALAALKTMQNTEPITGITLKEVVVFFKGRKSMGSIIFTHFGVSGPLIHNISADVLEKLPCRICFDFLPKISREGLLEILSENKEKSLSNRLAGLLPKRLARFIIGDVFSEQIAVEKVKGYCFDITGSLDFDFAMVTRGGVSRKEVFAKTMMSKKIKGLFFAGEILDIDGPTGGYNIQAAISTGYLAGVNAGKS